METGIAWPVLAALPAVTLALERAAEGADDEVVIGLRDRREGLNESSASAFGYGLASQLRPSLSRLTTVPA